MTAILVLALAVAGVNVAAGAWLLRWGAGRAWPQAAGFAFRFVVLFGSAQAVWARRRRAAEVVVFILTAAVVQLVAQVYLFLKKERKTSHA